MENTLQIIETNGIQTVSARELYKGLEIKLRFSQWWENNSKDFIKNEDFTSVSVNTEVQNNGGIQIRELQDYAISIDMAKAICLMSKTEIGKKYRTYLINLEKAWNEPGAVMARALEIAHKTLADCQKQVAIMQPKAEFYDDVTGSKDAIEMKEVAKVLNLGMGRNKIFEFLRDKKILDNNNQPYQIYVDKGYFRVIESKFTTPDGDVKINLKTVVMQKGLDFIRRQIKGLNESEIKTYRNKLANPTYMNNAINSIADRMVD